MSELRLRTDVLDWRIAGDDVVALDVANGEYLTANATGVRLWRALADGASRDELVALVVAEYAIEPAAATSDVDRFLTSLRERGLLEGQ